MRVGSCRRGRDRRGKALMDNYARARAFARTIYLYNKLRRAGARYSQVIKPFRSRRYRVYMCIILMRLYLYITSRIYPCNRISAFFLFFFSKGGELDAQTFARRMARMDRPRERGFSYREFFYIDWAQSSRLMRNCAY